MSQALESKAPGWFTVIVIVLLVWNLMGVVAYINQVTMSPEMLAALSEVDRGLIENTPTWAIAAFAIAVSGGALGCVLLLLRRSLAGLFLKLSLAGVLVQMFHSFFISESFDVFGPGGMVMPVMVAIVAIYLVVLAAKAKASHWTS